MKLQTCLLASAALCGSAWYLLHGRTGHPDLPRLRGWNYAHRGLHDDTRPENSMAAFRAALAHGYGVELDVHLMKDGNLAVIHDSALMRTTGREGRVEDLTAEELPLYRLGNSDETIPLFSQVLELFQGKAPLIVELKPVDGNHAALARAACELLADYPGLYCMESFDPRCVRWLRQHHPEIIRGQLTEYFLENDRKLPWPLRFAMSHNLSNCVGRPDFIAYRYAHRRRTPTNWICEKMLHLQGVSWTLQNPQQHSDAVQQSLIPIFEHYTPENPRPPQDQ